MKSWWQHSMPRNFRWSSESSNEKNVGTRFYLVIVRKHTKVKHFAFVASLSLFSYVWLCKFDQSITMMMTMGGCHFFGMRSFSTSEKKSCSQFCYCIQTFLHFWTDKNVRLYACLNRRKNVYLPIFTKNLHIIITHLSIQITVVTFSIVLWQRYKNPNSILGKTIIVRFCLVASALDKFKGGGFIIFWVLENTKFHTFKKCIRKYSPCNVITSNNWWLSSSCYVFSAAYWSNQ